MFDTQIIPGLGRKPEGNYDLTGAVIRGYQLLQQIGSGGFGAVYRAYQPVVEREVAVKVILAEYANQPDFIRRFETEAQLVARLEHPHIVPLYDYWREPIGAFIVMRFLRGGSLRLLLQKGPLDHPAMLRIVEQLASALTVAHRNGVVHCDIKPENILLDDDGNTYLADFGVAKVINTESEEGTAGSLLYMSPEQINREPVTPRADIYGMGILLHELVMGRHPFLDLKPSQLITKHLKEALPAVQGSGPWVARVNTVIQTATAKQPNARYPDVLTLTDAFRDALIGNGAVAHPVPEVAPVNPYKGLRPFQQTDAADFFGRKALVEQLVARLAEGGPLANFLAVVGPSGSGKSSVVKAGLLPALRAGALPGSDKWFSAEMVPGSHPFKELETALLGIAVDPPADLSEQLRADDQGIVRALGSLLPADAPALLLVIDQFEELFTQVEAEAERRLFLAALRAAVLAPGSRLRAVITVRADFIDRPLLYEGIGALMGKRIEFVLPLTRPELEEAIVGPVQRLGMSVDPELVNRIVAEVNEQPGALPLLQYALTEVFERRSGQTLTLQAYLDSGGVIGALGRRAEEVFNSLDATGQAMTRQLFLRLISLGDNTEDTRRRVLWSELASLAEGDPSLGIVRDAFTRYRLLTLDRDPETRAPTLEVAHEALIREWGRLRGWLDTSRAGIQSQRALTAAAVDWLKSGKDPSFLLGGARLAQFEEWSAVTDLQLTLEERDFIAAGVAERNRKQAEEAERVAREKRLERRARGRLRVLLAVMAFAAVIATGLAYVAYNQQLIAQNRAREIQSLALSDNVQRLLNEGDTDLALALSLAGGQDERSPASVRQALYRAAYTPGTRLLMADFKASVMSVAFSPDGKLAATGTGRRSPLDPIVENDIRIWDLSTGKVIQHLTRDNGGHTDTVLGLDFSPDGRMLASASIDKTIILWDTATWRPIRRLIGHRDWVVKIKFSPDGRTLLSSSGNFVADLLPVPLLGRSTDNSLRLWDVTTGQEIRRLSENGGVHKAPIAGIAFSPDGSLIASSDINGLIVVWDAATAKEIRRFEVPGDWVNDVDFALGGHALVAGVGKPSFGGSGSLSTYDMMMWDLDSGKLTRSFVGHTNTIIALDVSPDGRQALTASADKSVRLWDLSSGEQVGIFNGHDDWVFDIRFSPDGRFALSGSVDKTARLWDLQPGNVIRDFERVHKTPVSGLEISRSGKLALSGDNEAQIVLWDMTTGKVIRKFGGNGTGHKAEIKAVTFSADERLAASADAQGQVILWDVATGQEIRRFVGHTNAVLTVAFSPDGQVLATGGGEPLSRVPNEDNTIRLWNVATGREIRRLEGHTDDVNRVAFSPDGTKLVSGSGNNITTESDSSIRLWDITSGKEIRSIKSRTDMVNFVAFNTDGSLVVSGSNDGIIRLWNIQTGNEVRTFKGHSGSVPAVFFDDDGRVLVSGSFDGTVRLWDTATGEEIYRFTAYSRSVWNVGLAPDGHTLLTTSEIGEMRLWRIDLSMTELQSWLRSNRYIRDLTCAERTLYRVEPMCA